jgi:hypothetical protein
MSKVHLSRRKKWQDKAGRGGYGREEATKGILETYFRLDDNFTFFAKPKQLAKIYRGSWGLIPDFAIQNNITNKIAFFETKRQGINGNAHERACKYFAPGIQLIMLSIAGFERPIFTIYMDGLTEDPKKVVEIDTWYNDPKWKDRYLLWDRKVESLIYYWNNTVKGYLE